MQTSDQTTSSPNLGLLASSRDQTAASVSSPDPLSTATAPDPEATLLNAQLSPLNPPSSVIGLDRTRSDSLCSPTRSDTLGVPGSAPAAIAPSAGPVIGLDRTKTDSFSSPMRSDAPENQASAGTDAMPEPPTPFTYRGNGKVARLPKALRDKIGNWLVDGVSYLEIIEKLGEDGKDLKPDNLCEWKKRGHKQWLMEQTWLAQLRARQESASSMAEDFDATNLNHAALQLATLQIFEALRELISHKESSPPAQPQPHSSPSDLNNSDLGSPGAPRRSSPSTLNPQRLDTFLGGDSSAFARLLNALARASRETTQLQKYREDCAKARAALKPMLDPHRKLTESENRAIARKVSTLFGLDRELKPEEITFTYGHKLPGKEVEMFGVSKPLEGSNTATSSPAQKAPSSPLTSNNNI